ncbi:MAG: ATP synthase F1 subunit delta [Spirulinaceae cyanobacterium]
MKNSLLSSKIVEPYAEALMALAKDNDLVDSLGEDIKALENLLKESSELNGFLSNPVVKEDNKKAVLNQVLGEDTNNYLKSFLMLLIDRKRIVFLEEICQQYLEKLRQLKGTVLATVTSAAELNEEQKNAVTDKVKNMTSADSVELQTEIDPSLIGGVIIKVGSQVLDASLRGQLRRISMRLTSPN